MRFKQNEILPDYKSAASHAMFISDGFDPVGVYFDSKSKEHHVVTGDDFVKERKAQKEAGNDFYITFSDNYPHNESFFKSLADQGYR